MARKGSARSSKGKSVGRAARNKAARELSVAFEGVLAHPLAWRAPSLPSPPKNKPVQPTRLHSDYRRSSDGNVARLSKPEPLKAAVRSLAAKRTPARLERHKIRSALTLVSAPHSPDVRKSSVKARDQFRCKKRPDSKKAARSGKGSGTNKRFVPWC